MTFAYLNNWAGFSFVVSWPNTCVVEGSPTSAAVHLFPCHLWEDCFRESCPPLDTWSCCVYRLLSHSTLRIWPLTQGLKDVRLPQQPNCEIYQIFIHHHLSNHISEFRNLAYFCTYTDINEIYVLNVTTYYSIFWWWLAAAVRRQTYNPHSPQIALSQTLSIRVCPS